MRSVMRGLSADGSGQLTIGGVNVPALAREYGTPLYIIDENVVRGQCRALHKGMKESYSGDYALAFASKALCFKSLYKILLEEDMHADVVSGGEIFTALAGGFPANRMYFHGNAKPLAELEYALDAGVLRVVADNLTELERIEALAEKKGIICEISARITPGIDAHTHDFIKTGKIDSKFGVTLENGDAYEFARRAAAMKRVKLMSLHCHIGSQIFETEPFDLAIDVMLNFADKINREFGLDITEINLGGGFGIKYLKSDEPVELYEQGKRVGESVTAAANRLGVKLPRVVLEPGRSIVGEAGLTVYTIETVKKIPGVNTYVSVDGGMTDNPRCALYDAKYTPLLPERPDDEPTQTVTISGRSCEGGDVVTRGARIPEVKPGELLAVQSTGAYNYSMASHYNRLPNAPVVIVRDGSHRSAVRRETYADLVRNDL